jgi:hypothetical protein
MLALLRPRRERPRRCNAADNRNELAPLQSIELHPLAQPTPGQHIALVRISQGSLRCGIFNPAYVGSGSFASLLVAWVNRPHVRFASESDRIAAQQRIDAQGQTRTDELSWKTTRRFRRMLQSRASAANDDALKNVDMTDVGRRMSLRLPGNIIGGETP